MKITNLLALLMISLAVSGCESTNKTTKPDPKPTAKTAPKGPNLGTAGNPINRSPSGEYNGVDPMSTGVDGRQYNKNY